jgi:hypothetical protein
VSTTSARRLAWAVFAGATALLLADLVLEWATRNVSNSAGFGLSGAAFAGTILIALTFFSFAGTGVLIAARVPRNPIGWMLLAISYGWGLVTGSDRLRRLRAQGTSRPAPGGRRRRRRQRLGVGAARGAHGRLPAARLPGRPAAGPALASGRVDLRDGRRDRDRGRLPHAGAHDQPRVPAPPEPLWRPGAGPDPAGARGHRHRHPLGTVAAVASLVVRFRRAERVERLQIKWLAAAGTFSGVLYALALVSSALFAAAGRSEPGADAVILDIWFVTLSLIPTAIGVAVLRYRLFEIDVIIRRTLTYAALVGSLALPFRGVIQRTVDRRFYRSGHDAQAAVDGFSERMREQIDLDALRRELLAVVAGTVQPAHASVWLRRDPSDRQPG